MYSHIIFFLTLYFVSIFFPTKTLQYQPLHRLNQFGLSQTQKLHNNKKVNHNSLVPYYNNQYQTYQTPSYLIPHSRELHSVHNSIDEKWLRSVRPADQTSRHNFQKKRMNGHKSPVFSQSKASNSDLTKTKNYRRDAKIIDYPDFMSNEGIIPYYQSKLGPSSFRMKRNVIVANATGIDVNKNKISTAAKNERVSNTDDLIKSLEDSFSNPDFLKGDLEASFVPHIRVKRIFDENQ